LLLLVVDNLKGRVRPLLVDPVEEDRLVGLEVRLLDKECPEALDVLYSESDSHLTLIVRFLSLADQ